MSLSRLGRLIPGGPVVLPGAFALFIVVALLFRTEAVDLSRHDQIVENLRRLKELDAVFNRQILESRFGVLLSYDPLVESLRQLTNIYDGLAKGPSPIAGQGQPDIDRELEEYRKVLAQRAILVEQFKSENAILRNSLRYFPWGSRELAAAAQRRGEGTLGALVRELLQDVLLYNISGNPELKDQILRVSETLTQMRLGSRETAEGLSNVLAHARTIQEKKEEVDRLVLTLLSLPAAPRIDRVDDAYNRHHGASVRQLAISRFFLYVSSVLLLGGVGYIMLRLERSRAELERRAAEQQRLVEELSQTQDQLIQSQKIEAIGRLAGGVAHDFNNLLTVILGRCEVLAGRVHPDEPSHRDVDLIKKTAARGAGLTRQLLAFSRKQVLQPRVLDLNSVVSNLSPMLRRLIGEDLQLLTSLSPGLWPVKADAGQLEQILLNLAVNARDAMPSGGRLVIETRNVEFDEAFARLHPGSRSGPHVMLAVSDTGIGMNQETQRRIFEPFFTTKEPGKGTGLGLSTVYGIVKQHEGYISVESEPGRGAMFRIYLARVEEPVEPIEAGPTPGGLARGSETVLLVEDDEEVRDLAREILEGSGYTVLEAPAPDKALGIAERRASPIDLLVTDVVMPQMSGRELARRLSLLRPEMKVLYMSGYTDAALGSHGVLEAGTFFLQKPFTPDVLAQKVREVLDRARPSHL